jgi:hypothetical protein
MRNQLLLNPLKVKIPTIPQQLGPVLVVADMHRIPPQQMQQLRKHLRAAAFHGGRDDGRRAEQALAVETGEEVAAGGGEEGGEA